MKVLDLFSGIGGFSRGLERAGMKTIAFCEIEPYCQRVLKHHWPDVPLIADVKDVTANGSDLRPDVICGGFPCQGISLAGLGKGLADVRSALWWEYARVIGEFRPRWVIIENVPALRSRGLDQVLGSLATLGYDAEWHCIPAAALGAPHRRDRVWIVAYPNSQWELQPEGTEQDERRWVGDGSSTLADADSIDGGQGRQGRSDPGSERQPEPIRALRDTDSEGLALRPGEPGYPRPQLTAIERADWWLVEPDVGRVANGIPARVDRLRALGNSIVPQIAEAIGRAIMSAP